MIIYIVVACKGGVVEVVQPFFRQKEAGQYEDQLTSKKWSFKHDTVATYHVGRYNEEDDTVATYHTGLPLPASIQARIDKYLALKGKPRTIEEATKMSEMQSG